MKDFLQRALSKLKRVSFALCSVLVLYYILKFCIDQLAPLMPEIWEERLGQRIIARQSTDNQNYPNTVRFLQEKVDALSKHLPGKSKQFRVHLIDSGDVNASALPGRHIFVCRGLLEFVSSEEELSCILGHELGHIHHRDHLRDILLAL